MIALRLRNNEKSWETSEVVLVQDLESAYRSRMRLMKGPFTALVHHKPQGPPKVKPEAIHTAVTLLTHAHQAGYVLVLKNDRGRGVTARTEDLGTASTTGNFLADQFFAWLGTEYGAGLVNIGAMVCKSIGSTSTPSQHSDWATLPNYKLYGFPSRKSSGGGNAIDWYFLWDGRYEATRTDEAFYTAIHNAEPLGIQNIIHWPVTSRVPLIWNPERGMHTYDVPLGGNDHRTHGHTDFRPSRTSGNLC